MKSLKSCFQDTKKNKTAIGQFNFSAPEQLEAIVLAGKETNTPIILGTSQGEAKFFDLKNDQWFNLYHLIYLSAEICSLPVIQR